MSLKSIFSLIDLSKQFPFDIDSVVKKNICFAETLIISCGHFEGEVGVESSESEWSCTESEPTKVSQKTDENFIEIKDRLEEEAQPEESDEDDDFHFYFFPDCKKPLPSQDSKSSLLIERDGFPKINPGASASKWCTCDGSQGPCTCFTKLPCKCGAKTKKECTCETAENICICEDGQPRPVCTCRESKVCLCHPDNKPRPVCKCAAIEKPCICIPGKFPCPICMCNTCNCAHSKTLARACDCKQKTLAEIREMMPKPIKEVPEDTESSIFGEEGETVTVTGLGPEEMDIDEEKPCLCQKPPTPPRCYCLKEGRECICNPNACICGVQKTCICEPTDDHEPNCIHSHYVPKETISICSCNVPHVCTCDETPSGCKCFDDKNCRCGGPDNCKCKTVCECILPCICDTQDVGDECTCDKYAPKEPVCTCPQGKNSEALKLKRMRVGKEGYRWCHQVDPRHTFFDYGYGMHHNIEKGETYQEKIKILGLHDQRAEEEFCAVHGVKAPPFKKHIRRPSLDCCSTVGGISISVETLGEEEDKFLVQVVSNSSKEGSRTGSKLVSIVDCNLHTMEENRIEHITKRDITKERRSYMAICENGYYNKVTRICGEQTVVKRLYHTIEDAHNFLLEGSNVLLMRYFGLRRYKGVVKTDTVMIGGEVCESIYVSGGISQAVVNIKPMYVVKVERHIIEPSGNLHQTLTVVSLRGYMISHEWAEHPYVLHINPLLHVHVQKDLIEPHGPDRERWREDLQLLSDYLDMRRTRTSEGGRYVQENGTLTGVVREYLQAILMLKPAETVHFTRHYFGSMLSALNLPHNEYFDPGSKRVRTVLAPNKRRHTVLPSRYDSITFRVLNPKGMSCHWTVDKKGVS